MAKKKEVKFEDILPSQYFELSEDDKKIVCLASIKAMVNELAFRFGKEFTQPDIFKNILETTIMQYEQAENYETCAVLRDMLNMIDEL